MVFDTFCGFAAADYINAEHAAEAVHLLFGELVAGKIWQAGVEYAADFRVFFHGDGDGQGVFVVLADSYMQGS